MKRVTGSIVAVLLAACAAETSAVRPISDVIASEPEFVDITAHSATVLVTTQVDLACAVVYGPTAELGMLATDTDMAGGGHSDHHPLLTGLEPDTLYYARLQGSGPDGTLYRSELYTFRTLPADRVDRGDNLASSQNGGRVSAVSSNFGGGGNDGAFGAAKAVDGDPGSEWSSDGDGDSAWIEIELAQSARISELGFWTRSMGTTAQVESFQVVTDTGEIHGPYLLDNAAEAHYFEVDFVAQRLRFEVTSSSGGNTGAVEIEIYGDPVP